MTFYSRYTAWCEAMSNLIVELCSLDNTEGKQVWERIINDQSVIREFLVVVKEYNLWEDLEEFALTNDKYKVEGFFKTIDIQFEAWLSFWGDTFNQETESEFASFFYKLAFGFNKYIEFEEYNILVDLINDTNTELRDSFHSFGKLKANYTSLPHSEPKLFYNRIRIKLMSMKPRPTRRYTYEDWLNGGIDEILIRDYLDSGEDITRLVRPSIWEHFNKWLETRFKQPYIKANEDSPLSSNDPFNYKNFTYQELKDMIVNRLLYHEGNSLMLFTHAAVNFYPIEELGKINESTNEIHNKIIADNWYHIQRQIDLAIHRSIEPEKLIESCIDSLERYLNGESIELSFPVSLYSDFDQKEITDAYDYLLKGINETRYVRPPKKWKEEWSIKENLKDYADYHINHRSPFVEAELYIKVRNYLKQISTQPIKNPPPPDLSYEWSDGTESLNNLYELINNKLKLIIETEKKDFIAAFSGKPIGSFKPIKWHNDKATELLYFLTRMMPGLIADERDRMNYQRLIKCFVKKDGSEYDNERLKSAKQQIDTLGHTKKKAIDDLISLFL